MKFEMGLIDYRDQIFWKKEEMLNEKINRKIFLAYLDVNFRLFKLERIFTKKSLSFFIFFSEFFSSNVSSKVCLFILNLTLFISFLYQLTLSSSIPFFFLLKINFLSFFHSFYSIL